MATALFAEDPTRMPMQARAEQDWEFAVKGLETAAPVVPLPPTPWVNRRFTR